MRNLVKLKVILLAFIIITASSSFAADRILPKAKPNVDLETKAKTAKKKEIYPKKKPEAEKKINQEEESLEIIETPEKKEELFIYPEKKPIIVKKKVDKIVVKSQILSKRDFDIAKSVFKSIDEKKWKTAFFSFFP